MADLITAHNNMARLINAQIQQDFINGQLDKDGGSDQAKQTHQSLQCISCSDMCDPSSFTATCGHAYCTGCLPDYIESALHFDSTFPPRCCNRPLTLDLVSNHVGPELTQRYKDKQSSITAACSLACYNPGCRLIITEENIVSYLGRCITCGHKTCIKCRRAAHGDASCPSDEEREEVFKLAKESRWQSCYRCKNMIELNFGCNHMT